MIRPLPPPAESAGIAARGRWLDTANFRLMAATYQICCSMEIEPVTISPHFDALHAVLAGAPVAQPGAAQDFAQAKSLFLMLASCDLVGLPVIEGVFAPLIAPFTSVTLTADDPLKLSHRNNHVLMKALAVGLSAALSGNVDQWHRARQQYEGYLASVQDDGMLPAEAVRGASAAWYVNLAIMLITRFQTLARAVEGNVPADEREVLHRAVAALGRILDDPSILHPFCRDNMYPHTQHGADPFRIDLGFTRGYHGSRHYLAWLPLYASLRCTSPGCGEPLPESLGRLSSDNGDHFPRCSDFIGGFVDLMI